MIRTVELCMVALVLSIDLLNCAPPPALDVVQQGKAMMLVATKGPFYQLRDAGKDEMLVIRNSCILTALSHLICREKGRQRREGVSWAKG